MRSRSLGAVKCYMQICDNTADLWMTLSDTDRETSQFETVVKLPQLYQAYLAFTSAPWRINIWHISFKPSLAAEMIAVLPSTSSWLTSTPFSNKTLTVLTWLFTTAAWSGGRPCATFVNRGLSEDCLFSWHKTRQFETVSNTFAKKMILVSDTTSDVGSTGSTDEYIPNSEYPSEHAM